jgi:hypothetical protein
MPIIGLITGMCSAIAISQIISLIHAASHIKIDFLQLNDYAAIANPGVRGFLVSIATLTMFPLIVLYVDDPIISAFLMRISLSFLFITIVILLPYVYPIWILRNRIRDKKIAEMGSFYRTSHRCWQR